METFTGTTFNINNTQYYLLWLQIVDSLSELEALMERMKRLQEEREDEEASQEEMTTRFEKEKKESQENYLRIISDENSDDGMKILIGQSRSGFLKISERKINGKCHFCETAYKLARKLDDSN